MKTEQREHDALQRGDFVKHSKGWYMVVRVLSRAAVCTTYHAVFADGTQAGMIVYSVADTAPRGEVPESFKPGAMRSRAAKLQREAENLQAKAKLLQRMATNLP